MCGLTGGLSTYQFAVLRNALPAMTNAVKHRGPDDEGYWFDPEAGFALGHRRLAVLDPGIQGHQPMKSVSGRYIIAFNGEIYNHLELRRELKSGGSAPEWRGHSDTETLLACIESWGQEQTLKKCVGMFAFVIWDIPNRRLTLARDRFGEKPLYYGWQNGTFLFASQPKSLVTYPGFTNRVDRNALALLLRYGYVPTPYSIWDGVSKLPPATYLEIRLGATEAARPVSYWSLPALATTGSGSRNSYTDVEAVNMLESRLNRSVAGQMIADVPLGALLSGGIDSSTVVAMLQAQSSIPVKTFSIGFEEKTHDESVHAEAVANHLGTDHTTLIMSRQNILDAVTRMPEIYDEPFADSSQLPTSLVMSLARKHVTVALSGDGGDEIFGGYNRYIRNPRIWRLMKPIPYAARNTIGKLLLRLVDEQKNPLHTYLPDRLHRFYLKDKLIKAADLLKQVHDFNDLYLHLHTKWNNAEAVVRDAIPGDCILDRRDEWPAPAMQTERMMLVDTMTYLPDDILVKIDRAAMAISLETRAPLLDHRIAEFVCSLPLSQNIRKGQGKWLLRELLYRYVPRELIDRPKTGFRVPLKSWLRGPLRDWAESLLSVDILDSGGFFNTTLIRDAWESHVSGKRQLGSQLWPVLMFQAWLQKQDRHPS